MSKQYEDPERRYIHEREQPHTLPPLERNSGEVVGIFASHEHGDPGKVETVGEFVVGSIDEYVAKRRIEKRLAALEESVDLLFCAVAEIIALLPSEHIGR